MPFKFKSQSFLSLMSLNYNQTKLYGMYQLQYYKHQDTSIMQSNEPADFPISYHTKIINKQEYVMFIYNNQQNVLTIQILPLIVGPAKEIFKSIINDKTIPPILQAMYGKSLSNIYSNLKVSQEQDINFYVNRQKNKINFDLQIQGLDEQSKRKNYCLQTEVIKCYSDNEVDRKINQNYRKMDCRLQQVMSKQSLKIQQQIDDTKQKVQIFQFKMMKILRQFHGEMETQRKIIQQLRNQKSNQNKPTIKEPIILTLGATKDEQNLDQFKQYNNFSPANYRYPLNLQTQFKHCLEGFQINKENKEITGFTEFRSKNADIFMLFCEKNDIWKTWQNLIKNSKGDQKMGNRGIQWTAKIKLQNQVNQNHNFLFGLINPDQVQILNSLKGNYKEQKSNLMKVAIFCQYFKKTIKIYNLQDCENEYIKQIDALMDIQIKLMFQLENKRPKISKILYIINQKLLFNFQNLTGRLTNISLPTMVPFVYNFTSFTKFMIYQPQL